MIAPRGAVVEWRPVQRTLWTRLPVAAKGLSTPELERRAEDYFERFPWDPPPPDPGELPAARFLDGL